MNQRAKVLFRTDKFYDALAIWELLLKEEWPYLLTEQAFASRMAGIAAAFTGNWGRAQHFFDLGARFCSKTLVQDLMRVGLIGDEAFAFWRNGQKQEALKLFADLLIELEKSRDLTDLRSRILHAKAAHTISWVFSDALRKQSNLAEPPPGFMSDSETNEALKDVKPLALPFVWALLSNIEATLGLSIGIGALGPHKLGDEVPLLYRILSPHEQLHRDFTAGNFGRLIDDYVQMYQALNLAKSVFEQNIDPLSITEISSLPENYWTDENRVMSLINLLLTGMICHATRRIDSPPPSDQWRRRGLEIGISHPIFLRFIDLVEGKIAVCEDEEIYQNVVESLFQMQSCRQVPNQLFKSHFYLLSFLTQTEWGLFATLDVTNYFIEGWSYAVEHQRFAFLTPAFRIPEIKEACLDESLSGLQKAANILLVASKALTINLDPSAKDFLRRLCRPE